MKLVIIESPYAGDVERNIAYARACVRDSLARGEAPYASHLFFTQDGLLDDDDPEQREQGIDAGLAWGEKADLCAVYTDLGISSGMRVGICRGVENGIRVESRSLGGEWAEHRPLRLAGFVVEDEGGAWCSGAPYVSHLF